MRAVILCLALFGLIDAAAAADLDDSVLRGSDAYQPQSPTYTRWSGFYAGGQVGVAGSHMDFTNTTRPLLADTLRNLIFLNAGVADAVALGEQDTHRNSYGFFFGYNSQWEALVLGAELSYNRTSLAGSQSRSPAPFLVSPGDGNTYATTITGSASTNITDFGTLRARVGYIIGNFLPYATVGFAAGRADINNSTNVSFRCTNVNPPTCTAIGNQIALPAQPNSLILSGKWLYGYSAGLGLEVALPSNMFVRGEWEFIQFGPFSNTRANLNSARVGGGVRF